MCALRPVYLPLSRQGGSPRRGSRACAPRTRPLRRQRLGCGGAACAAACGRRSSCPLCAPLLRSPHAFPPTPRAGIAQLTLGERAILTVSPDFGCAATPRGAACASLRLWRASPAACPRFLGPQLRQPAHGPDSARIHAHLRRGAGQHRVRAASQPRRRCAKGQLGLMPLCASLRSQRRGLRPEAHDLEHSHRGGAAGGAHCAGAAWPARHIRQALVHRPLL